MKNRNSIFFVHILFSGIYGTKGTGTTSTIPGGRSDASSWTDPNGNIWLFGGDGNDSSSFFGEFLIHFLISQRNRK